MATALKLSINRWAAEDRPIDKLQTQGTNALSDSELLSIIIGSGTQQYNAVDIAKNVLQIFDNNLNALGKARIDQIKGVDGVGAVTACKIMAAVELGRRRELCKAKAQMAIQSATAIYNLMHPILMDLTHEEFHILLMNQNFKLIKLLKLSQGGLTETAVDVRVIIREAVLCNAITIAMVHNHPSGNIKPSRYDDNVTETIKKACDTMRLHLLDHVIVTDGQYYSYAEQGRI